MPSVLKNMSSFFSFVSPIKFQRAKEPALTHFSEAAHLFAAFVQKRTIFSKY